MKFACFSVAALDFYPQLNQSFAGGNSLNQAIRLKRSGLESAFIGALGNDLNGDKIFDLLQRNEVNVSHTHRCDGPTASNRLVNDAAGERFGEDGAWQGGVYEDYLLAEEDWVCLRGFDVWSTHINCPSFNEAVKRKSSSQLMAVDFLHLKDYEVLEACSDKVDIAYFGGDVSMQADLADLARKINVIIVLTLGAGGSIAFNGQTVTRQKALDLDKVVDTTGCGDAFQAAFTASYFKDQNMEQALLEGAEQGQLAASHFGGVPW